MALTYVNCRRQVFGSCFDSPKIVFGLLIRSIWEAGPEQFVLEGETSQEDQIPGVKEGGSLHSPLLSSYLLAAFLLGTQLLKWAQEILEEGKNCSVEGRGDAVIVGDKAWVYSNPWI